MLNGKYSDRPISRSTVGKIECKFRGTEHVKDIAKPDRSNVSEDKEVDILLSMENHLHSYRLVSIENEFSQRTVLRVLKKEKYHLYKIQLVEEGAQRR